MHVPTYNFGEIEGNLPEIQKRTVDALFHVRDSDGPSAVVVSLFLPEAQCHVLIELDADAPHRCQLTIVSRTMDKANVNRHLTAKEYEQAVQYVTHIIRQFQERRTISNLSITTDGRRVHDVRSLIQQHGSVPTEN